MQTDATGDDTATATAPDDEALMAVDQETDGLDGARQAGAADDEPNLMERRDDSPGNRSRRAVFGVPIEVVVSVGTARPLIGELLAMRRDALIPLDSRIEDPVEIRVGEKVIARGELQELGDGSGRLGVRLIEIVSISDFL